MVFDVLVPKRRRRGQLEYGRKAMFSSRGPISLDPTNLVGCKWAYWGRDGGKGGGCTVLREDDIWGHGGGDTGGHWGGGGGATIKVYTGGV
jgi:hypothetical protein